MATQQIVRLSEGTGTMLILSKYAADFEDGAQFLLIGKTLSIAWDSLADNGSSTSDAMSSSTWLLSIDATSLIG